VIQAAAGACITTFVCTAAWLDATTRRIPNQLSVAGLAAALILRAPLGVDAIQNGLTGACIALLLSLVMYALRAIGGGDVKLLTGIGAFMGSSEIVGAIALMAVFGEAFALVSVVRRGVLPLLLLYTVDLVKSLRSFGRAGQLRKLESAGSLTITYAVPIAAGTLIWWFGRGIQL